MTSERPKEGSSSDKARLFQAVKRAVQGPGAELGVGLEQFSRKRDGLKAGNPVQAMLEGCFLKCKAVKGGEDLAVSSV